MRRRGFHAATAALLAVGLAAGCGSSSNTSSKGRTITIGVLTDVTGLASSANKTTVDGVRAGVVLAKRHGYTLKYFVGDTATSPATALSAAQTLVVQDHVMAVVANSALTFAAANYLKAQGIPVIGVSSDANEWNQDSNMFAINGPFYTNLITSTQGDLFKLEGGTNVGVLGYSISPSSSGNAKAWAASAEHAGLKLGYLNANFAFGSTDVEPVALAMKAAGVDTVTATVDPNTLFALVTALRQVGSHIKMAEFATGYGADLIRSGPGAEAAAQGGYFLLGFEPIEMHTSATKQFASDLAAAGISGEPTFGSYSGYVTIGLLLEALKGAGSQPTPASLIQSLSSIHDWNALGLWGGRTLDINDRSQRTFNVNNCIWVTKFVGSSFQLVPGADPICGTTLGNA